MLPGHRVRDGGRGRPRAGGPDRFRLKQTGAVGKVAVPVADVGELEVADLGRGRRPWNIISAATAARGRVLGVKRGSEQGSWLAGRGDATLEVPRRGPARRGLAG